MTVFSERRRRLLMASDGGTQVVNYTMLYDAGDECVDVTGGWGTDGYTNSGQTIAEGRKEPSEGWMRVQGMSSAGKTSMLGTLSPVDFSAYAVVGILSENTGSTTRMGFITSLSKTNFASSASYTLEIVPSTKKIYTASLVDAENTKYAQIYAGYNSATPFLYLYHAWLAKQDDWQTLCEKAGLNPASYADESALCADAAAMAAILGNADAVGFMVSNCTGSFMTTFVASSTALSAYSASAYKDVIDTNLHWTKFLAMAL